MFVYLAELHEAKTAAGHIAAGSAAQSLSGVPEAAAPRAGGAEGGGGGAAQAWRGPSGGGVLSGGGAVAVPENSGAGAAALPPAGGQLEPGKRRGQKTLAQRLSKAAGKAGSKMRELIAAGH